jgi:hypothetical protein
MTTYITFGCWMLLSDKVSQYTADMMNRMSQNISLPQVWHSHDAMFA